MLYNLSWFCCIIIFVGNEFLNLVEYCLFFYVGLMVLLVKYKVMYYYGYCDLVGKFFFCFEINVEISLCWKEWCDMDFFFFFWFRVSYDVLMYRFV